MNPLLEHRRVLVIAGPTASGKSDVAVRVAELAGGEIISADSRQMYRLATIGTAKPGSDLLGRVRHHFVDSHDLDQPLSAGEFGEEGRRVIEALFFRSLVPVVVGGSGLYLRSLIDGFFTGDSADPGMRDVLLRKLEQEGLATLFGELARVDPGTAGRIDRNNPRRVLRALEVFYSTGEPLSEIQKKRRIVVNFTSAWFGLEWEMKELYRRIDERVGRMMEAGLVEEVRGLLSRGYDVGGRGNTLLATVGYAEAASHLRGEYGFEEMVELIKRNTRRYAKRQMTWFRKEKRIEWVPIHAEAESDAIAERIMRKFSAAVGR